jgi:hypothetical protein
MALPVNIKELIEQRVVESTRIDTSPTGIQ